MTGIGPFESQRPPHLAGSQFPDAISQSHESGEALDCAELTPDSVEQQKPGYLANMKERLGRVALAFKDDWSEEDALGRSVQVAAVAAQGIERSRVSEWGIVPAAFSVLQTTGSPVLTGTALFGMIAGSQALISHTWTEAMNRSPKTVDAINNEFPKLVEVAEDMGPAKDKKWYSHIREGLSSLLVYGVTPFVVSEKIREPEMTSRQLHASAAKLTGKCALAGFGLSFTVAEVLTNVDQNVATDIINVIDKPYFWFGLAMLMEIPRFVAKRFGRNKSHRQI